MEQNHNLLDTGLTVDQESFSYLRETAKWAKFLSILGFVVSGLFVLLALSADALLSNTTPAGSQVVSPAVFMLIYFVIAAVNFVICLYLYRFAVKTQLALTTSDQFNLTAGFANLKTVFKFMGIIAIIYIAIVVLAIIGGVIAGIMSA